MEIKGEFINFVEIRGEMKYALNIDLRGMDDPANDFNVLMDLLSVTSI